ncbi:replication initiator protein A [Anaerotruncus colihominis]
MPPFFRYPRFLLKMDLSQTAKLLYSLLLDRSELSQKNGWQDSEGRTYIVYPVSEIAEMLDKGSTAIKAALNELDAAGLLVRERRGFSAPNRLYVKVPQVPVVQFSDHMTAIQSENRPSDSRKSDPHKDGKPTPNQLTINKLKENQLKGASEKPPAPFGRYQNVLLSESEYAELKEEYPDRLERLIEEMSEFIAATGNDYVCHAAALRRWLNREKKENPKKGIPDYSYKEGESL